MCRLNAGRRASQSSPKHLSGVNLFCGPLGSRSLLSEICCSQWNTPTKLGWQLRDPGAEKPAARERGANDVGTCDGTCGREGRRREAKE